MDRAIEVELKFQVLDDKEISSFLTNLDFVNLKTVVDVYLDKAKADLFKKGIFIRIRNNKKLDFKFNMEDFLGKSFEDLHEHCDEYSFKIPIQEESIQNLNNVIKILKLCPVRKNSLAEFMENNQLIESMKIDKNRRIFKDDKFEYSLDDVKSLGKFLEIEFLTEETTELESIKQEMRKKLKGLGLRPITVGYNELYWRKKDFNLYMQGKYILEQDKILKFTK